MNNLQRGSFSSSPPPKKHKMEMIDISKKQDVQEQLMDEKFQDLEKKLDDLDSTESMNDFKRYDGSIGCVRNFKQWLILKLARRRDVEVKPRVVEFGSSINTEGFKSQNIVRNQKYSIISLLPMVLIEQFRYFFNLFFLVITISQFIPQFKVGFLFSYVAPLVFVLTMTLAKEAYDDYQRYKRDNEANSQVYHIWTAKGKVPIKSLELRVGNIVDVSINQRVPADMILLSTQDKTGSVFIRTDQLDGETDWKSRQALKQLSQTPQQELLGLNGQLIIEPPKLDIYDFKGVLKLHDLTESQRESISLVNTLWANTFVATGNVTGIIIYTGRQCRSAMNSREPRSKMGKLDKELNFLSKVLFLFMCFVALIIVGVSQFQDNWIIQLFRHILLLSSIIPISLRVNLDFSKMIFSAKINRDKDIPGALARNSTIPEELGRISYILSDKTGTLTQNSMVFKKISLDSVQFTDKTLQGITKILVKQCLTQYPMSDLVGKQKKKNVRRAKAAMVRDLVTALALCHNVTPIMDGLEKSFQASSPDEISLVQAADKMGIQVISRTQRQISIQTPGGVEVYEIVQDFPFTSERKRMGIILRCDAVEGYFFYLKGADNVMKQKVPDVQRGFLMDECEMLSREGLRTLVIAQKYLTIQEYNQWKIQYDIANALMADRETRVSQAIDFLENDMEFLGITGVEDMLQEDIAQTIDTLRNAGIFIWMLTGDKVETAQCIAISTGLKSPQQEMFVIQNIEDYMSMQTQLNNFANKLNTVLVIDGQSLAIALSQCLGQFMHVSCLAPSVICCRCSPTQKAQVTESIRNFSKKIILAIGDGGNDVAMICAANVGVGIVGKEGKQAALASDFSINRFKDIAPLLLWHGRLAYKRSSVMAQFVMHRGLVISIIQMIFSLVYYQIAIPVYNGWLMLGYATVFTMLPVFCLIFDEDVSKVKALEFAELYRSLLKGRELTWKTFLIWLWNSIYQGTVIMAFTFLFFENTFFNLVTVTFTSLIVIEILNVFSEITKVTLFIAIAQLITCIVYFTAIITLREYINVSVLTIDFFLKVTALVTLSWLPIHVVRTVIRRLYPSESQKIMQKIHAA